MGPLHGVRVVEMEGIGPLLHAGMLLADLGAEVVRIIRPATSAPDDGVEDPNGPMLRGRCTVQADLKSPRGLASVRDVLRHADVLMEGFRPGTMERLGLGPEALLEDNPRLIYGRMTGWGQDGPLAATAGHDINYLAVAGALHPMGPGDAAPVPPLNYAGNFGGGSMFLVVGVLAALYDRVTTGRGQVVDAAMVEGASSLTGLLRAWQHTGRWSRERGGNLLDGSAPFYRAYACADGRYMAVGALEDGFYGEFVRGLGLDAEALPDRWDRDCWPRLAQVFTATIATRTRHQWVTAFEGIDACFTPVLDLDESTEHPHAKARGAFLTDGGAALAAPAPRLSAHRLAPAARRDSDLAAVAALWSTTLPKIKRP